jgi:hypothetical protein
VDAGGEGEVLAGVGATHVEPGRLGEDLEVMVGAGKHEHHQLAGAQVDAVQLEVLLDDAAGALHGRVEAQRLLDQVGGQAGIGAEALELVGWRSSAITPLPIRLAPRAEPGRAAVVHPQRGGAGQPRRRHPRRLRRRGRAWYPADPGHSAPGLLVPAPLRPVPMVSERLLPGPGPRHCSRLLVGPPLGADDEERCAGCFDSTSAVDVPASGIIPGRGSASGYRCPLGETASASRRTPAWIARSPRPP